MARGPLAPSQYESVTIPPRLPFVVVTSNRDGTVTKDARLVNCYIEVSKEGELDIYKRPGTALAATVAVGELGRGVYFWNGNLYSIFGNTIYKDGVSLATGLDDTNGVYRFDAILGATPKMVFGNGHAAYSTDGTTVSAEWNSIDSDYPATTVKGFAYLNGPIYVMQSQAVIWGSAVNSVDQAGDWDPLNFIRAQIEPDQGVFMAKQLVYVVALKQWTIEYFFDAGNTTGSPLGSVQGMKLPYGCAHEDSVQKINDVLFFMSIDQTNSLQISSVAKGSHKIVSTPSIDRLLSDSNITTVYSWQLKIDGHSWYIITLKESNLTLAYDITQDLWFQWTDTNGNYFPIVASSYDAQGRHILQHEDDGTLYYISNDYAKDLSSPIIQEIITPNFDAGTFRRKQLKILKIIGDQVEGAVLEIRHNDNDYDSNSWSPYRTIDMGSRNPLITDCGTFIRRAYHIRFTKDLRVRLRAAEVQYDIGTL